MLFRSGRRAASMLATCAVALAALTVPGSASTAATADPVVARKILAVKIPNARWGDFPQRGLPNADLVYTELVEGGMTRHVGVFSSSVPPLVAPLRSLRETDLQLLRQYGKIGIAYSGHAPEMKTAATTSGQVLFSEQLGAREIYRDQARCSSHGYLSCVTLNAPAAFAKLRGASGRATVLSRAGLPAGAVSARATNGYGATRLTMRFPQQLTATYSRSTAQYTVKTAALPSTGLRWNASSRRWTSSPLTAGTVILQHVSVTRVRTSYPCRPAWAGGWTHVYRSNSVGSGTGLMLRGGRAYPIRWSRASATDDTTYVHAVAGSPRVTIAGRPWVFMLPDRATAQVTRSSGVVSRWTPPARPTPASTFAPDSKRTCPHLVLMGSYPTTVGGVRRIAVRLRDQWTSAAGIPVSNSSDVRLQLRAANGVTGSLTLSAAGTAVLPANMVGSGWVRVTLPPLAKTTQHPAYPETVVTVLKSSGHGRGTVLLGRSGGGRATTTQFVRTGLISATSRLVRVDSTYFGATRPEGPVAFWVQRRPESSRSWTTVSSVETSTYRSGAATENRSMWGMPVDARVAYYFRSVMRTADGYYATSSGLRVGPAKRTMSWTWRLTQRVGQSLAIRRPAVSPSGTPTYVSLSTGICRVTGTSTKYVKGVARGTCRLRASVAGNAYALPATTTIAFPVTR